MDHRQTYFSYSGQQQHEHARRLMQSSNSNNALHSGLEGWASESNDEGGGAAENDILSGSNATNTIDAPNDDSKSLAPWALVLIGMGMSLFFVAWCVFAVQSYWHSRANSRTGGESASAEIPKEKYLSEKDRKSRLIAHFEETGHRLKVQVQNIQRHRTSTTPENRNDIEHGNCSRHCEISQPTGDEGKIDKDATISTTDDDCLSESAASHSIPVLVLDRTDAAVLTSCNDDNEFNPSPNNRDTSKSDDCSRSVSPVENGDSIGSGKAKIESIAGSWRSTDSKPYIVYDACAVCLEFYQVGDFVVWSCTDACPHVFHQDCFVDYLLSYRGSGIPCPSCRQPFCDESIFGSPDDEEDGQNDRSVADSGPSIIPSNPPAMATESPSTER